MAKHGGKLRASPIEQSQPLGELLATVVGADDLVVARLIEARFRHKRKTPSLGRRWMLLGVSMVGRRMSTPPSVSLRQSCVFVSEWHLDQGQRF